MGMEGRLIRKGGNVGEHLEGEWKKGGVGTGNVAAGERRRH